MIYPVLANRLLLNLRDTKDYTTRTAVSNFLFDLSRLGEEAVDEEIRENIRPGPGEEPGSDAVAGRGTEVEDHNDIPEPPSALSTGVESRIVASLRHNGSMV